MPVQPSSLAIDSRDEIRFAGHSDGLELNRDASDVQKRFPKECTGARAAIRDADDAASTTADTLCGAQTAASSSASHGLKEPNNTIATYPHALRQASSHNKSTFASSHGVFNARNLSPSCHPDVSALREAPGVDGPVDLHDLPEAKEPSDGSNKSEPASERTKSNKSLTESAQEREGSEYSHTSSDDMRLDQRLRDELPKKWILTLSMHFRDGSMREKFFITYIRKPNEWFRLSVSIDYSNAEKGSLEEDLSTLQLQRDKNFCIYKAVWESLQDIHFFDTVTNLKLETKDERLHIHVAEDANERIPYPPLNSLRHLDFKAQGWFAVPESEVLFVSHLSGFVYKVRVEDKLCVKKEITSIDTVQEFLYEIEALAALRNSPYVINLVGVVTSEEDRNGNKSITGLLLEYAKGGALNDYFYDNVEVDLDWNTRMTWIRQVVHGLADIHEAGYVQGDCTLSNVVLDDNEDAEIVDINRRGCPIGWEPPEFRGMIHSGQRISMFIGIKSDLYQMGMVLWAIAHQVEEPDRFERPLEFDQEDPDVPSELVTVINSCLAEDPTDRRSAKELLTVLKPFSEYKRAPHMTIKDLSIVPTRQDIEASKRKQRRLRYRMHSREMSEEGDPRRFNEEDPPLDNDLNEALLGLATGTHGDQGVGITPGLMDLSGDAFAEQLESAFGRHFGDLSREASHSLHTDYSSADPLTYQEKGKGKS